MGRPLSLPDPSEGPVQALAHFLVSARVSRGLTRKDAAAACQLRESSLAEYERGTRAPPPARGDAMRRLAEVLLVDDGELRRLWQRALENPLASRRPEFPDTLEFPERVFVGRTEEQAVLQDLWEECQRGSHRHVVVTGNGGFGKTALVSAFAGDAYGQGGVVLYGRCRPDEGWFHPIVNAIEPYIRSRTDDELLAAAGPGISQLAPLLPAIGLRLGDRLPQVRGEPAAQRHWLFETFAALLKAATLEGPVLLILDDVQWAAGSTLALLRYLSSSRRPMALLLVVVSRSSQHPEIEGVEGGGGLALNLSRGSLDWREIRLGPLTPTEIKDWLTQLSEGRQRLQQTEDLAQLVHDGTAGYPLYIDQVWRHLESHGLLQARYEVVSSSISDLLSEHPSDQGFESFILRLVDNLLSTLPHLSKVTQRVLDVASVAGTTFSRELLERVVPLVSGGEDLGTSLKEAQAANLILNAGSSGYGFRHSRIREAIYNRIDPSLLPWLHRHVGDAMEDLLGDGCSSEVLAYHFFKAVETGAVEKCARYSLAAGRKAINELALEEAVRIMERALGCLDGVKDVFGSLVIELLLALAEAQAGLADFPAFRARLADVVPLCIEAGAGDALARAAILLTGWGIFVGQPDPTPITVCRQAEERLDPSSRVLRARVLAGLAHCLAWQEGCGPDAAIVSQQAINLATGSNDSEALAYCLITRCMVLQYSSCSSEQVELASQAVRLAHDSGHTRLLVDSYAVRMRASLELGMLEAVASDGRRLAHLAMERGSWLARINGSMYEGMLALLQGRFDEVTLHANDLLVTAPKELNYSNVYLGQMFYLYRELGQLEQQGVLQRLTALVREEDVPIVFQAGLALAHAELRNDNHATRTLAELCSDWDALPRDPTWAGMLCILAETCGVLRQHDPQADLVSYCRDIYGYLEEFSGRLVVISAAVCAGSADRYLAILATVIQDWKSAARHFELALQLEERVGARAALARSRTWYAWMLTEQNGPNDSEKARTLIASAEEWAGEAQAKQLVGVCQDLWARTRPAALGRTGLSETFERF